MAISNKFVTQYKNWFHNVSESGNQIESIYERYVDEVTKEVSLKKIGERDVYDEIQQAGVGLTFKEMLAKYEKGIVTAEQFSIGSNYDKENIDISDLPTDFVNMQNYIKDMEKKVNDVVKKSKKVDKIVKEYIQLQLSQNGDVLGNDREKGDEENGK